MNVYTQNVSRSQLAVSLSGKDLEADMTSAQSQAIHQAVLELSLLPPSLHLEQEEQRMTAKGFTSRHGPSPVMNRCQLMSLSCDMLIFSTQKLELA